jgi:hypothetical protein
MKDNSTPTTLHHDYSIENCGLNKHTYKAVKLYYNGREGN